MLGISFRRLGSIGNSSHLQFDPELVVNLPSLKQTAKAPEYEWLENDDSYQNGLLTGAFAVSFGDCIWPHGLDRQASDEFLWLQTRLPWI